MAKSARSLETSAVAEAMAGQAENAKFLFIVFSSEREENTIEYAVLAKNIFYKRNLIRIPLSGILIKYISLRPLRLCGEIILLADRGCFYEKI